MDIVLRFSSTDRACLEQRNWKQRDRTGTQERNMSARAKHRNRKSQGKEIRNGVWNTQIGGGGSPSWYRFLLLCLGCVSHLWSFFSCEEKTSNKHCLSLHLLLSPHNLWVPKSIAVGNSSLVLFLILIQSLSSPSSGSITPCYFSLHCSNLIIFVKKHWNSATHCKWQQVDHDGKAWSFDGCRTA